MGTCCYESICIYIFFGNQLNVSLFLRDSISSSDSGREHIVPEVERVFSGHLFVRCYLNTTRQIFKPMYKLRTSFKYRKKNQLITKIPLLAPENNLHVKLL